MAEADIWEKLCVIDTENESGSLYVGTVVNGVRVGEYLTINLEAPFSAARYLEAIDVAEQNGVEFLIIDSLSHAWSGEGGLLDVQSNIAKRSGNSYTAWREVTPQHNKLVDRVLQCPMHVAITLRGIAPTVQIIYPDTAAAYFDDQPVTVKTPFVAEEGEHTVRFVIGNYETVRTVNVVKGRSYTIALSVDASITEEE